jgi:hypothetical protein
MLDLEETSATTDEWDGVPLAQRVPLALRWLQLVEQALGRTLRANIDETVLLVVITEQGENRNQCEEQRNLFGFSYGLARRGT